MADLILTKQTTLPSEEVITRAVQFFATAKWRPTTQSNRAATFEGMIPIPWITILLTVIGYLCCIIPGIIMYFMLIRKMRRFQNIVVTVTPRDASTDLVVDLPEPC